VTPSTYELQPAIYTYAAIADVSMMAPQLQRELILICMIPNQEGLLPLYNYDAITRGPGAENCGPRLRLFARIYYNYKHQKIQKDLLPVSSGEVGPSGTVDI
jgi:hypothetical protein